MCRLGHNGQWGLLVVSTARPQSVTLMYWPEMRSKNSHFPQDAPVADCFGPAAHSSFCVAVREFLLVFVLGHLFVVVVVVWVLAVVGVRKGVRQLEKGQERKVSAQQRCPHLEAIWSLRMAPSCSVRTIQQVRD